MNSGVKMWAGLQFVSLCTNNNRYLKKVFHSFFRNRRIRHLGLLRTCMYQGRTRTISWGVHRVRFTEHHNSVDKFTDNFQSIFRQVSFFPT